MSNLNDLILTNLNNDVAKLFYREIVNKYGNPPVKEFDPTQSDALLQLESGSLFNRYDPTSASYNILPNKYYEFAEVDKAGNITIYTIFLTDVAQKCCTRARIQKLQCKLSRFF